jgi:hypothetical protein
MMKCNRPLILISIVTLFATQTAVASGDFTPTAPPALTDNSQSAMGNSNDPHTSVTKFKKYLNDKYKKISDSQSRVIRTAHGPSGSIFVMGDIEPHNVPDLLNVKNKQDRARIIAKSFIEDEKSLFGNINPDELREYTLHDGTLENLDYLTVYYRRYINGIKLQDSELHITVGKKENIRSFTAELVAVPPEVYEATQKKTLTENEIRTIVEADITEADKRDFDMNNLFTSYEREAIIKPPYVIWRAVYLYEYEIDAFTGKILHKVSIIKSE